jgi:hypothetical protein
MITFQRIRKRITDEADIKNTINLSNLAKTYLLAIGTKCGKVAVYRLTTQAPFTFNKLFTTRTGLSFGAITSIDI